MSFGTEFNNWLSSNLNEEVPSAVQGFSFNLYEPALTEGVKFGVELIGAERFDPDDEDWACEEIWSPRQRQLLIPVEYSGDNWEECLKMIKTLTVSYLSTSSLEAEKLKSRKGVGIGFVDGNLEILLQP